MTRRTAALVRDARERRSVTPVQRVRAGEASIEDLGFMCFRLVPVGDPEDGGPAYEPMRLYETRNAMGAFTLLR